MQVINSIITAGVAVLAIGLITYAVGKMMVSMPEMGVGSAQAIGWNNTMLNISANSLTAFNLLSISPLVIGVGLIISVLIGAFAYMYTREG